MVSKQSLEVRVVCTWEGERAGGGSVWDNIMVDGTHEGGVGLWFALRVVARQPALKFVENCVLRRAHKTHDHSKSCCCSNVKCVCVRVLADVWMLGNDWKSVIDMAEQHVTWPSGDAPLREDELVLFAYCRLRWLDGAWDEHDADEYADCATELNNRFAE